ncbi:MAG: transglycosylase domain-containing protein [Anaerovoracaceae bacterium]
MSDDFNKDPDSKKELEDFLAQFDKISNDFSNRPKETSPANQPSSSPDLLDKTDFPSNPRKISVNMIELEAKYGDGGMEETREKEKSSQKKTGVAMSKTKKKRKHRFNALKLIRNLIVLFAALGVCLAVWASVIIIKLPPLNDDIYSMLPQNSTIYDDQGKIIDNLYLQGNGLRTNLDYTQIPKQLIDSFIAVEDKTFWEHKGFNFIRIAGAIWDSATSGTSIKGTSTITQQLARNLYLENKRSMTRKISEAWYAIQLERKFSKQQIISAYLNSTYLGSNSNGVAAASQSYFSKDVKELNLAECALLASIPKSPARYSPMATISNDNLTDAESMDIIERNEDFTIIYKDDYIPRQQLILSFMEEQGYITAAEKQEALNYSIRDSLKPGGDQSANISSYFQSFLVKQVTNDLMAEFKLSEEDARDLVYNGGLKIHSTLNLNTQKAVEGIYASTGNFPGVANLKKDKKGNVMDAGGKNVLYYAYNNMFDSEGNFVLSSDEFKKNPDGSLTIYKGNRLNFFRTQVQGKEDISVEFKPMYYMEKGIFYSIGTSYTSYLLIPSEYKKRDKDGNLILSKEMFEKSSIAQLKDNNSIVISPEYYQLGQKVMQPQSAIVIMDYRTGAVKAMVGGRGMTGKMLYNRAIQPRQPGSAIKPISVYAPVLQRTVDGIEGAGGAGGKVQWTAATAIEDKATTRNGKVWPKNWYNGYRGWMTLRKSIEESVNTNAVKVWEDLGAGDSAAFLKKLGVTTVTESGSVNDMNPAALALGGMAKGISPLEMAAAYSAFPNKGIYTEPSAYTKITYRSGDVLFEKKPDQRRVMDPGVAFIMTDILRTTVSNGIAGRASFPGQPVAGKTGTTSDNYDAWFVGVTPYYSAAVWIGNDVNIQLTQGSPAAAKLWSQVMAQVHKGLPGGSFPPIPANVVSASIDTTTGDLASQFSIAAGTARSEYFIRGTVPSKYGVPRTSGDEEDGSKTVTICADTGCLATPYCKNRLSRTYMAEEKPSYYCHLHNLNPDDYPVTPGLTADPDFQWDGVYHNDPGAPAPDQYKPTSPPPAPVPPPEPTPDPNGNSGGGGNADENNQNSGSPPTDSDGGIPDWLR